MNRCKSGFVRRPRARAALLAPLMFLSFSLPAPAQTAAPAAPPRDFPAAAQRADFAVTMPPEILLNGKVDKLSPGARIYGTNNLVILSGAIAGQTFRVNYVREAAGLVHQVWLLTPEEAALRRPGMPPSVAESLRNFLFGSETARPKDGIAPVDRPYVPGK